MPWSSLSSRALLVAVAMLVAAGTAGCGGSGSAEESMTSLKKSRAGSPLRLVNGSTAIELCAWFACARPNPRS